MSDRTSIPVATLDAKRGDVRVELSLAFTLTEVWRALAEPDRVARWLGRLDDELREGVSTRLDFGDGDFFTLEVRRVVPPLVLEYDWRFLGISPVSEIAWRLAPAGAGCRLTVRDREPGRPEHASQALGTGWVDFVSRLDRFLATGRTTRYAWRGEVEAWIELPCSAERAVEVLFDGEAAGEARWLPLDGERIEDGARLVAAPSGERIDVWGVHRGARGVRFLAGDPGWREPTQVLVGVQPRGDTCVLGVQHIGWKRTGAPPGTAKRLRAAFAGAWIGAFEQARELAASAAYAHR